VNERRRDPTTGEWRIFADHRQDRTFLPPEDHCPLCPTRPDREPTEIPFPTFQVAVFENRFPSLVRDPKPPAAEDSELYQVAPSLGANEVVVYSDRHDVGLQQMDVTAISRVVEVWADRYAELGRRREVAYVFVFENRGVAVGVTLHHPHGQIYAYPEIPPRARLEIDAARAHLDRCGRCVFCDVVEREAGEGVRLVATNADFVAFVPFAARFPYEVHVMSRRHVPSVVELTVGERLALAELLKAVLVGYDNLFGFALPYVMSIHQAPTDGGDHDQLSHLHVEFTPLHRSVDKLKHLAGSELGAGAFLNDVGPEESAARLRAALEGRR
jgi:UDPglucose--hexose-1-phosphate uridylyltransferase